MAHLGKKPKKYKYPVRNPQISGRFPEMPEKPPEILQKNQKSRHFNS